MLDLNESLSYLIDKCSQKSFRILSRKLLDYGITPAQAVVINCLYQKDGISQLELCEKTLKDRTTISGILYRLEAEGFVTRISDQNDKRIVRIYLTQKARDAEEKLDEAAINLNKTLVQDLTKDELNCLISTLKKIMNSKETL